MKHLLKSYTVLLLMLVISFAGCNKDEDFVQQLITSNLAIKGKIEPELLVGEWDIIGYAYTKDGKKISKITNIDDFDFWNILYIPFVTTPQDSKLEERWKLSLCQTYWFDCTLSGNLINLEHNSISGFSFGIYCPADNDKFLAFKNAHSFVIRGNELIIHFTGIKDKNLLILRKRAQHDLIASNLLKSGDIDRALLLGEWECVKVANTVDGNTITDVSNIKKGRVSITEKVVEHYPGNVAIYINLSLFYTNTRIYSTVNAPFDIDGQFIHFFPYEVTQNVSTAPQEEMDLDHVFRHVYSFVVRGDELIFHFTKGNNKNLLILKKLEL